MLTPELHERIGRLSHTKRQLLNQELRRSRMDGSGSQPSPPGAAAPFSPIPSYTQRSILRTQANYPRATFYNHAQVFRMDGPLDIGALAQALRYLWARHDVLRTHFETAAGAWRPIVQDPRAPAAIELQHSDLSPLSSTIVLEELLLQHRSRRFDLAGDPPLAVLLIRVAPQCHVLSLVHHFVAFDHWSLRLFNRELGLAYSAFAAGGAPQLSPPPFGYADYAAWQHSSENQERLADMSHFWRWQLTKALASRGDAQSRAQAAAASPAPSFGASSFEFCVPAGTLRRLELQARRENATLFMLLLASLQTLLMHYLQRTELAVSTLAANRQPLATEAVLGNFSNRLLLWGNLSGNPSFRQLLRRVRGTTLNAYARQEVPLDLLAAELLGAGGGQGELFPVMLNYVNEPLPALNLRGLAVRPIPAHNDWSEHPLHVTAQRSHDHLRVRLQMWPDFAVRTTVPHMACHWNTLLAAIADHPEQRIGSLPIVKNLARDPLGPWLGCASSLFDSSAARL